MQYKDRFLVRNGICVITGGAGLLGRKHAEAVLEGNGIPVLLDVTESALAEAKDILLAEYKGAVIETFTVDITDRTALENVKDSLMKKY